MECSHCKAPCSGTILTSFFKSVPNHELENLIPEEVKAYNQYMKWFEFPTGLKGFFAKQHKTIFFKYHIFRIWMEKQVEICKDLLWHTNIWQNHQGQSCKVCRYAVSNWWHHGTTHWFLHHQWSGNSILYCKNNFSEMICAALKINIFH